MIKSPASNPQEHVNYTHTLLYSSAVTLRPVTRQIQVRTSLKMQSFIDDQAVTVLLEQEDGMCVKGHSLTRRSGYNEL